MKETGIEKFNRQNHNYINWVSRDNIHSTIIIRGTAGFMRYMYYSWREAVRRYNTRARENGAYKHSY